MSLHVFGLVLAFSTRKRWTINEWGWSIHHADETVLSIKKKKVLSWQFDAIQLCNALFHAPATSLTHKEN